VKLWLELVAVEGAFIGWTLLCLWIGMHFRDEEK